MSENKNQQLLKNYLGFKDLILASSFSLSMTIYSNSALTLEFCPWKHFTSNIFIFIRTAKHLKLSNKRPELVDNRKGLNEISSIYSTMRALSLEKIAPANQQIWESFITKCNGMNRAKPFDCASVSISEWKIIGNHVWLWLKLLNWKTNNFRFPIGSCYCANLIIQ